MAELFHVQVTVFLRSFGYLGYKTHSFHNITSTRHINKRPKYHDLEDSFDHKYGFCLLASLNNLCFLFLERSSLSIFTTPCPLPHLPTLLILPTPIHTSFHFPQEKQEKHLSFLIHFTSPLYSKDQLKLGALPPCSFSTPTHITVLTKLNYSWFSHLPPCT